MRPENKDLACRGAWALLAAVTGITYWLIFH